MGKRPRQTCIRFLWSLWTIASLLVGPRVAVAEVPGVDSKELFEIVYETSSTGERSVFNARVVDVVKIGSREFLVIEPTGVTGVKGYVDLEHVRSILPSGKFDRL